MHKKIDKRLMPQEYGGLIPKEKHIEAFKERCRMHRNQMLALDQLNYEVSRDASYRKKSEAGEIEKGTIGSFRKLQLD